MHNDKITVSTHQLFAMFPDQETARTYLESRLWPKGVRCPICGMGDRIGVHSAGHYRCFQCKEAFTVRTGTVMERSHVPLHKWLYAMYLLVTARKGIASLQLSKEIGITQKSAWFVLHRLREACGKNMDKLRGIVEIDEYGVVMKPPKELDRIADVVLAYRPKPKSKPARKRARRHGPVVLPPAGPRTIMSNEGHRAWVFEFQFKPGKRGNTIAQYVAAWNAANNLKGE